MEIQEFKTKLNSMIARLKFKPLLQKPINENSPAGEYLKSRGLNPKEIEGYDFEGNFNYKGKDFKIPESIVIPLRDTKGVLIGVWIRFLHEKRFFIWMVEDNQKYWVDIKDLNEPIYIAESIFDACSFREIFKVKNVAASLGVTVTSELIEQLQNFDAVLCFDNDTAGLKGMLNHQDQQNTKHWKIFKQKLLDRYNVKDYNELLKLVNLSELDEPKEIETLSSIQAKIYLKSKLS